MTEHLPDELQKAAAAYREARLPASDRAMIRAALDVHMRTPVRMPLRDRLWSKTRHAVPSPYQSWILKPMPILAILLATTLLGGGTSYAAQGSLPGDLLYPVKVDVNEAVQQALAFTPASRASVETALAATRLQEAQQLAVEGKLSTSTAAMLESNLASHLKQASQNIATLASTSPAEAADANSSLQARIIANKDVLASLVGNASTTQSHITGLVASMTAHLDAIAKQGDKIRAEAASSTSPDAVKGLAERAQAQLENAMRDVAALPAAVGTTTATSSLARFVQQAQDALATAKGQYATGTTTLAAGDTAGATTAFYASLSASAQAQTYANAARRLNKIPSVRGEEGNKEQGREDMNTATTSGAFPGKGEGEMHASAEGIQHASERGDMRVRPTEGSTTDRATATSDHTSEQASASSTENSNTGSTEQGDAGSTSSSTTPSVHGDD